MHRTPISLIALSFAVFLGAEARAQSAATDLDAPVATAPREAPSDVVAGMPGAQTSSVMLGGAESPLARPAAAAVRRESVTSADDAPFDRGVDKVIDLAPGVSLGSRKVNAGEAGGGFLRTNPELQRSQRKQVGFSFRF